ncbi:MAG: MBL fold metallo-hydrolase [Candidatus Melainabacteria bacterium]|nr:MBL fold metallo-hydrolase [Candidatus Melainabacteria bacterium]
MVNETTPAALEDSADWLLETFPVGPLGCNCTILGHRPSGEALVIDPGGDADKIRQRLQENQLTLSQIVHTHAHFDHFLASGDLRGESDVSLALHPADRFLWNMLPVQCAMFGIPYQAVPSPEASLAHEQPLALGGCSCGWVLHTPGHTPGSVSFVLPVVRCVAAGDTLFRQSVGRTDLWGGDAKTLQRSIRQHLYTLDESLSVIPGHGSKTTIGHELRYNPFVSASSTV